MADFTKGKWRAVYYTPEYIAMSNLVRPERLGRNATPSTNLAPAPI